MTAFPEPLEKLIRSLGRLPGIGPKSASRLAFYILKASKTEIQDLSQALREVKETVHPCPICGTPSTDGRCSLCHDSRRDQTCICVVEQPRDIAAFERVGEYRGLYHVLYGVLSPLDGINPENLKVKELLARLQDGTVQEVVVAVSPTVEGEATALYLARLIRPLGVEVTRLASGVPVGSDLEYTDEVTLARAFEGRRPLGGASS